MHAWNTNRSRLSVAPKVAEGHWTDLSNCGVLNHMPEHFLTLWCARRRGLAEGNAVFALLPRARADFGFWATKPWQTTNAPSKLQGASLCAILSPIVVEKVVHCLPLLLVSARSSRMFDPSIAILRRAGSSSL